MPNEQRMQDFINLERPIQDFLGWVLSLDQAQFTEVLEQAGHHAPKYQAEKWAEFKANALAFVWNWTPAFVAAWNSLDQKLYTSPGLTMLVFDKNRSNVSPLMFRANEGDLTHTFVMGTTRQGMSARWSPTAESAAEHDEKMIAIPRSLLVGLVAVADEECSVGSPNHAHEVPGIWDSDNGEKAGQPCAECAMYDFARRIVAETA